MPKKKSKATSVLTESLMQTSSQSNDPYFLFRDDLEGRLKKIQTHFENWEVLFRNENCESSAAFKKSHADLQKKLNTAKKMANELTRSVSNVKQNRKMFPHISENELESRQFFIDSSKKTISKIQATLRSPETQGKIDADRKAVLGGNGGSKVKAVSIQCSSTRDYVNNGREYQQDVLASQDRDIEEIDIALDGIHGAGQDIYNEIDDQNKLLAELNRDVQSTQTAMDKINENLLKLLATKDGCQLGIVIAMSIICVVMVLLMIFSLV